MRPRRIPLRTVCVDAPGPIMVQGEEASLRQVIVNLVTNSLTYTPTTATITVHAASLGDKVVLDVADSGPGMSPNDASKAFDRFWRAEASRTRPGSGLGLSIVAGIVAAARRRGHARIGLKWRHTSPRGIAFDTRIMIEMYGSSRVRCVQLKHTHSLRNKGGDVSRSNGTDQQSWRESDLGFTASSLQ